MLDVYRTYYKMTGEPFRLSPDHRFSLAHSSYANAMSYLQYAIFQGEGFIAVTGGPGTGKTTLISDLIEGLDKEHIEVATLTSTQLESRDLLQMVVNLFDLHPDDKSKPGLLQELEQFLNQQSYKGRRVILIVDEAQGLTTGALEELRLLANLQRNHQLLLQVFLVGQEQLLEMLRAPGMEHLHQRLIAASHLQPLGLDEVIDYVEHRLSRVGWKGDPAIDEGALRLIHKYSGGIPRRINLICNRLFLYGGLGQKHELDAKDAQLVVDELNKEFLLSTESAGENEQEDVAEHKGDGKAPVRKLPRRDMNAKPAAAPDRPSPAEPREKAEKSTPPKARRQSTNTKQATDKPRRTSAPSGMRKKAPEQVAPDRVAGRRNRIEPTMRREPTIGAARPVPAPAPEQPAKRRSWGKMAALVVLVGFVYVAYDEIKEFDLASVFENKDEVKPHAAFNAPLDNGMSSEKPVQVEEPVASEPAGGEVETVPGNEETVSAQTAIVEDMSPVVPVAAVDAGAEETTAPDANLGSTEGDTGSPSEPSEPTTLPGTGGSQAEETASSDSVLPTPPEPVVRASEKEDVIAPEQGNVTKADKSIKVASAQSPEPVKPPKREPVKVETVNAAAETARLRREAELRLAMNLNRPEATPKTAVATPVKAVPVPKKKLTPPPVSSKPQAPVKVATAPRIKAAPKRSPLDKLKAAVLEGQWDSRGKPASLLPSKVTYCNSLGERIACLSVPQDINTKYGAALYKVETTLQGFSEGNNFQLSYRTLVKLLGDDLDSSREAALSSDSGWQISEYSMSCQLTQPDQVRCRDKKGVTREYHRSKPAVMN